MNNPFDIDNILHFGNFSNKLKKCSFNKYKLCSFKIDIILCKENLSIKNVIENITSNSDFFCNALYIYHFSLEINKNIAKYLKEFDFESLQTNEIKKNIDIFLKKKCYTSDVIQIIKKQIYQKEAVVLNLSKKSQMRKNKIISKGYKILYNQYVYDEIFCKDEICLLCRSDILEDKECIKFKCCNSFFHKECLSDWMKQKEINKCFVCSKSIDCKVLKNIF